MDDNVIDLDLSVVLLLRMMPALNGSSAICTTVICLSDTKSILKGKGSTSDAKVISVGTNDQQMSLTTRAVHFGRSTESDMVTRAVMKDEATAIINGITKIEKGATKANGVQTEKVLMLSPKARGDANPILLDRRR